MSVSHPHQRITLLGVGLLLIVGSAMSIAMASRATVLFASQTLSHYWRTTYDILVRPTGSLSSIEEKYGLVEANFLAGIGGGISYQQYQAILGIPGVEVSAPIAMLTYVEEDMDLEGNYTRLQPPPEQGFYRLKTIWYIDEGIRVQQQVDQFYTYVRGDPSVDLKGYSSLLGDRIGTGRLIGTGSAEIPLLLAAVVPGEEAALIGLNRALIDGKFLTGKEKIVLREQGLDPSLNPDFVEGIPVLINTTPYLKFRLVGRVERVVLPPDVTQPSDVLDRGGANYLDTLPGE